MNKDTLALLSGMAPKEPERWALDEWAAQFMKDYPTPWGGHCFSAPRSELWHACEAALIASGVSKLDAPEMVLKHLKDNDPAMHYVRWRDECLTEFTRNEWPLLWAKKRYSEADKLLNGSD